VKRSKKTINHSITQSINQSINRSFHPSIHPSNNVTSQTTNIQNKNVSIVRVLVEKKANIDAQNANGDTALMLAARLPSYGMISELVRHGANDDLENSKGETVYSIQVEISIILPYLACPFLFYCFFFRSVFLKLCPLSLSCTFVYSYNIYNASTTKHTATATALRTHLYLHLWIHLHHISTIIPLFFLLCSRTTLARA
jgi:hypothetical protein